MSAKHVVELTFWVVLALVAIGWPAYRIVRNERRLRRPVEPGLYALELRYAGRQPERARVYHDDGEFVRYKLSHATVPVPEVEACLPRRAFNEVYVRIGPREPPRPWPRPGKEQS